MPVLLASFHHPRQRVLCRTQPMHAADKGRLLSERVFSYWHFLLALGRFRLQYTRSGIDQLLTHTVRLGLDCGAQFDDLPPSCGSCYCCGRRGGIII